MNCVILLLIALVTGSAVHESLRHVSLPLIYAGLSSHKKTIKDFLKIKSARNIELPRESSFVDFRVDRHNNEREYLASVLALVVRR